MNVKHYLIRYLTFLCLLLCATLAWAGTWRDDFEDGDLKGWKILPGEERFSIINGVVRVDNFNTPDFEADLYLMDPNWRDYSFSADMRILQVEPGGWSGGAIYVRWKGLGTYDDYALFGAVVNGWNARSNTTQNGGIATVWNQKLPGAPKIGEWHRMKIAAIGDTISFYIDGKSQFQRNDDLHPSGGAGLMAFDALVEFDNVVIEGPNIPDVGPSGWSVDTTPKLTTTWGEIRRML